MQSKVFLIIEDSPDDEKLMRRALELVEERTHLVVARDGAQALQLLFGPEGNSSQPVILPTAILLDLKLPKVGGLEVLAAIRGSSVTRHIPVIVLSSSDEERDVAESFRLGANSYIRKPIQFSAFLDTLRQIERYWMVLNIPYSAAGS
ncbi:MAG: response regulator [Armatimonadetes bacterium]|uniref:Two-component system response regulator n=1 Tax=Candidatus Nitrosymbiomonas proteolyticus TaxID=2608984 RepID=A0A809R5Q2_9BACT|nr:MAG: response regulator [Armatimonadota bacterium]MBV6490902.1 Response regulator rcp1 [Fimbriimonadaceae bacterium]QOJ11459.1 MAG: response regulator [Chthonomonadaceae bacterium]BBO22903.1 two-component system response regulator [Candidatus Nitrosymbiomonas proteolyticus]MBL1152784.1 response regulator [Armatimonadota bacterium]